MKRRGARFALLVGALWSIAFARDAFAAPTKVTVYDDGIKLRGERDRPLPPTPYPRETVELFALPGETVALQIVIDADEELDDVHAEIAALDGGALPLSITSYAERFVRVDRPSGNAREPGSLAFTAQAAPDPEPFVGYLADALVPKPLHVEAGGRGALWIDLFVPDAAPAGLYEATLMIASHRGTVASPRVRLEIGASKIPYAGARVAMFYDPLTLDRRMGGREAETSLRQLLHAHHVSALPERTTPDAIELDLEALSGKLFTEARRYRGPGAGIGEGVYAIGAYGSLGDPSPEKLAIVERFVDRIRSEGALDRTLVFVYAVDEDCKSPRAAQWLTLLERARLRNEIRVGVTCHEPPRNQAASFVMLPTPRYDPESAAAGKKAGKVVWAYNGIRPHAGPLMLDVPALDLRVNAWIAKRYDVDGWFYWESSYWLDNHGGGKGGDRGWDPYVVAETFHNKDGDYAMQDGIFVYPGTQKVPGFVDYGEDAFYPSVRLKNVRRGVLDAGYIELARAKDRAHADAIVKQMVPIALAEAKEGSRASWADDPVAFVTARRALFLLAEGPPVPQPPATSPGRALLAPATRPYVVFGAAALLVLAVLVWIRKSLAR